MSISLVELTPLALFVLGALVTCWVLVLSDNIFNGQQANIIVFRTRRYFIDIFVALAVAGYFATITGQQILKILILAVAINVCVGWLQFLVSPFTRASMLFVEPSSAGYFFSSFIFLVYFALKLEFKRTTGFFYFISSLLISSKAQIAVYIAFPILRYLNVKGLMLLAVLIPLAVIAFIVFDVHSILFNFSDQYRGFIFVANSLVSLGFADALSDSNTYGTYITRLSGIYLAVQMFVEYPWGIGFGAYSVFFPTYYHEYFIFSGLATANELKEILEGVKLATPKSALMELFVSTGVLGIVLLFVGSIVIIVKGSRISRYVPISFICFILASTLVELNNFFLYFSVFAALVNKTDLIYISKKNVE